MTRQTLLNLIFNGLGALLGLTILGYVAYSLVHKEVEPPCSARYPAPTRFALYASGGGLLTPLELQARVGLNEWGINENAKVVADTAAPGGAALEVSLKSVPEIETGGRHANGIHFRWTPQGVRAASSACLSYSLWLPNDFAFDTAGLLPALFGGANGAAATAVGSEGGFAARFAWRAGGDAALFVATAGQGFAAVNQAGFPLPKGRFMRIEQELVLNAPGEANGTARLWLDGELKAETKRLELRKDTSATIAGVLADIGYVRAPAKPGVLRLTPFELSWK
jgi:hypothetical protein